MVLRVSAFLLVASVAEAILLQHVCFPSLLKAPPHLVRARLPREMNLPVLFTFEAGGFTLPFFRILRLAAIVCSCASQLGAYLRV